MAAKPTAPLPPPAPPAPPAPKGSTVTPAVPVPAYRLVIDAADFTGTTGHHELTVHIEESLSGRVIATGTSNRFGIHPNVLQSRFGNDISKWREWIGNEMLTRHRNARSVQTELLTWKGKSYDIK
jgi:hypothetical protein